jgi:hypothetical protein
MLTDMLTADEAVKQIGSAVASNRRVLGVDGFRIIPEGYIAALDLILDVSNKLMTFETAAAKTVEFIRSNAASDVVFEVVIADAADGS